MFHHRHNGSFRQIFKVDIKWTQKINHRMGCFSGLGVWSFITDLFTLQVSDDDVTAGLDDDVMMISMSESEFRSKDKKELTRICGNWKQVTLFEVNVSNLRKNPLYVQVRKLWAPFYGLSKSLKDRLSTLRALRLLIEYLVQLGWIWWGEVWWDLRCCFCTHVGLFTFRLKDCCH